VSTLESHENSYVNSYDKELEMLGYFKSRICKRGNYSRRICKNEGGHTEEVI